MDRREALMTLIAGGVFGIVGDTVSQTSPKTNRAEIALWLVPARECQWQIWEIISYLSTHYSNTNRRIPVFPPHATLCTGHLEYGTQEEFEDQKKRLFDRVRNFCANEEPLSRQVEEFGHIPWWSQFFYLRLNREGWPKVGSDIFKPLLEVKPPTSHDNKPTLMPHVSLMYCPNSNAVNFNDIDLDKKVKDQIFHLPDHIVFDAISIVTPGSTNDWEAIVTRPPQQWKVIYTRPFGQAPPCGTLEEVVAGGQTGVDTAALRAAWSGGLAIGGWSPPDGRNLDGEIPLEYLLTNTPEERSPGAPDIARSLRTQRNTRDSDATLILRRFNDDDSWEFSPDAIANPESVVAGLMHPTNELSVWLWEQFSRQDKEVLENSRSDKGKLREVLATNFNRVLGSDSITNEIRHFDSFKVSSATAKLLEGQEPPDPLLFKRRLFEDAFPNGFDPLLDPGTLYTCWSAVGFGRPVLMWDPNKATNRDIDEVVNWIKRNNVKKLNVGGPARQTMPGVDKTAYNFLSQVFARARKS